MDKMEERLQSLFQKHPEEENTPAVRDVVLQHRKRQLEDAFQEAYSNNRMDNFEVPCLLGLALRTGLMDYLSEKGPKGMQQFTGKEVTGDSVKWLFGKDSRGEEFISGLEAYANRHNMKHTGRILDNTKAVRTAIDGAYGSMEEYKEDIISHLSELNEGLQTINSMNLDTFVDTVTGIAGGEKGFNPLSMMIQSYMDKLKNTDNVQRYNAKADELRSQTVDFGRQFLQTYGETRAAEARKYEG